MLNVASRLWHGWSAVVSVIFLDVKNSVPAYRQCLPIPGIIFGSNVRQPAQWSYFLLQGTGADPGGPWGLSPLPVEMAPSGAKDLQARKSLVVHFRGPANHHATPLSCNTALQKRLGALRS